MAYRCPRCSEVYDEGEECPLCGLPINVPFKHEEATPRDVPKMNCPECGKEMERGIVQIEYERIRGYGTKWFPQNEEVTLGLGGEFLHPYYDRKPGVRCRTCGLILLRWVGIETASPKEPMRDQAQATGTGGGLSVDILPDTGMTWKARCPKCQTVFEISTSKSPALGHQKLLPKCPSCGNRRGIEVGVQDPVTWIP